MYMEILVFKFESPIFNNKENKMLAPPPLDAPGQKVFFWISLIYMEILVFKFEGPISNNKGNKMFVSPPWDAPGQKIEIFFIL